MGRSCLAHQLLLIISVGNMFWKIGNLFYLWIILLSKICELESTFILELLQGALITRGKFVPFSSGFSSYILQ